MITSPFKFRLLLVTCASIALAGCGTDLKTEAKYPTGADRIDNTSIYEKPKTIFGEGSLFSTKRNKDKEGNGSGIAVNSFLWRAALDTVSFMPLASADPFGGTILTDWNSPDGVENERFKMNVFILSRQLRSDGIRVRAFKQVLKNGSWHDAKISDETARQLEDTILTRARQLRVAQIDRKE